MHTLLKAAIRLAAAQKRGQGPLLKESREEHWLWSAGSCEAAPSASHWQVACKPHPSVWWPAAISVGKAACSLSFAKFLAVWLLSDSAIWSLTASPTILHQYLYLKSKHSTPVLTHLCSPPCPVVQVAHTEWRLPKKSVFQNYGQVLVWLTGL